MTDFIRWVEVTITPGEPHAILPGRNVKLAAVPYPHTLTADQATAFACRLMECADVPVVAKFSPEREASTNERHLLSLLSWRESEAKALKEALAVVEKQLAVAIDRSESWKNLATKYKESAEAKQEGIDKLRETLAAFAESNSRLREGLMMIAQIRHVDGSAQGAFRHNLDIADAVLAGADVRNLDEVELIARRQWLPKKEKSQ